MPEESKEPNPYVQFLRSEAWAAAAGLSVYLLFRLSAFLGEEIAVRLPVQDSAPADFFSAVLNWGSALGGSATFVVITVYQIVILTKRMWSEVSS